jgi:alanine racemase
MEGYLTAEISAAAVRHNAALLRACIAPGTQLCAVVKADCYGHGLTTLLGVLSGLADRLAVASPEEALDLRRLGCELPILVFFPPCAYADEAQLHDTLAELVRQDVTLTVAAAQEVAAIGRAARREGAEAEVHVKIDTGMGRGGAGPDLAPRLVEHVRRETGIRLTGLYTHFAAADATDKTFARDQLARFLEAADAIGAAGLTRHAANSAATIDLPETHLDMIRPGIALYGCQPSDKMHNRLPLKPALRLTGRLMQIKTLPAGSRCGYGLTHTFTRDTRVGLVPVGYADGYMRCLSNRATMRIRGRDVPVRGRVSMDQVIIELTDVPEAAVGDEVEIISNDPAAPHSVEALARLADTIPYEITCRLGQRARRVLVDADGT